MHIKSEPMDEDSFEIEPSITPHPPELNTFDDLPNGSSLNELGRYISNNSGHSILFILYNFFFISFIFFFVKTFRNYVS